MHIYWGPREKWLLRCEFTPELPTASAFGSAGTLCLGPNAFQWAPKQHSSEWTSTVLLISHAQVPSVAALRLEGCLMSAFDGVYTYSGSANDKPCWSKEYGADGIHVYRGPSNLWLLRSCFKPNEKTCSAYSEPKDDSPIGVNDWFFKQDDKWIKQELDIRSVVVDSAVADTIPPATVGATAPKPQTAGSGNSRPSSESSELPQGWQEVVSTSTAPGDVYFVNIYTGESTWDKPTEPASTAQASGLNAALPFGWVPKVSATSGDTFYFNELSGQSSWQCPARDSSSDDTALRAIFEHSDAGGKGWLNREDVANLIRAMGCKQQQQQQHHHHRNDLCMCRASELRLVAATRALCLRYTSLRIYYIR